jgi:hypothetical protein
VDEDVDGLCADDAERERRRARVARRLPRVDRPLLRFVQAQGKERAGELDIPALLQREQAL